MKVKLLKRLRADFPIFNRNNEYRLIQEDYGMHNMMCDYDSGWDIDLEKLLKKRRELLLEKARYFYKVDKKRYV